MFPDEEDDKEFWRSRRWWELGASTGRLSSFQPPQMQQSPPRYVSLERSSTMRDLYTRDYDPRMHTAQLINAGYRRYLMMMGRTKRVVWAKSVERVEAQYPGGRVSAPTMDGMVATNEDVILGDEKDGAFANVRGFCTSC
jgi:hypothetical protein